MCVGDRPNLLRPTLQGRPLTGDRFPAKALERIPLQGSKPHSMAYSAENIDEFTVLDSTESHKKPLRRHAI